MKILTKATIAASVAILTLMVSVSSNAYSLKQYDTTLLQQSQKQLNCLALNIYFEARGESRLGQRAVAWVTLNRVQSPDYPDNICDVVWEDSQFSWTNDGKTDTPKDADAWIEAIGIANMVMQNYEQYEDPTEGAVMFHSTSVSPGWKKSYEKVTRIDNHIFYKEES